MQAISIHAAREGGDAFTASIGTKLAAFQSTPPVKAATRCNHKGRRNLRISIHAAREGGDLAMLMLRHAYLYISIHAAREGGDDVTSGSSCRGSISIHAAREGGDKNQKEQ